MSESLFLHINSTPNPSCSASLAAQPAVEKTMFGVLRQWLFPKHTCPQVAAVTSTEQQTAAESCSFRSDWQGEQSIHSDTVTGSIPISVTLNEHDGDQIGIKGNSCCWFDPHAVEAKETNSSLSKSVFDFFFLFTTVFWILLSNNDGRKYTNTTNAVVLIYGFTTKTVWTSIKHSSCAV